MVKRHLEDDEFVLHSFPKNKSSSISAHIHFAAKDEDWTEYRYNLYKKLYPYIELFQFFFKNSPNKDDKTLSHRHFSGTWCDLHQHDKNSFENGGRRYNALTLNPNFGTLEFRFNDVPKSLNQLNLLYYLVYLATEYNLKVPKIPTDLKIDKLNDLEKPIKSLFSYKDKKSVRLYNQSYKKILYDFLDDINKNVKVKFYDFYGDRYVTFKTLVTNSLKYETKLFDSFFKSKTSTENKWSNDLKKRFCKPIKMEMIKR